MTERSDLELLFHEERNETYQNQLGFGLDFLVQFEKSMPFPQPITSKTKTPNPKQQ